MPLVEVAAAVGITRSHLNKIELDQDQPSVPVLKALAEYYGVRLDDLEGGPQSSGPKVADERHYSASEVVWGMLLAEILELTPEQQRAAIAAVRKAIFDHRDKGRSASRRPRPRKGR